MRFVVSMRSSLWLQAGGAADGGDAEAILQRLSRASLMQINSCVQRFT